MVGGAIADSPHYRTVRGSPSTGSGQAFPSFGSSEYGPLSLTPLDDPDVLDEAKSVYRYVCGHDTVRKHIAGRTFTPQIHCLMIGRR